MTTYTSTDVPENHFDGGRNMDKASGKGPTLAEVVRDSYDQVNTHASRHETGGADALTDIAAAATIDGGADTIGGHEARHADGGADALTDVPAAATIGGVATRTLGNLPVLERSLALTPTNLSTAATTIVVSFASALPASAILVGGRLRVTTALTGGAVTALTAQVGSTANPDMILDTGNVLITGTAVDRAAAGDLFDGTLAPYPQAAFTPVVTVTSTGANLSALTAGAATAYVYYVVPQV